MLILIVSVSVSVTHCVYFASADEREPNTLIKYTSAKSIADTEKKKEYRFQLIPTKKSTTMPMN